MEEVKPQKYKKPLTHTKFFKVLKSVVRGAVDDAPVIGPIVNNLLEDSQENPKGKIDIARLIAQVATLGLIYLYVSNKLSDEQLNYLVNLLTSLL